jgi:hypothetical protein
MIVQATVTKIKDQRAITRMRAQIRRTNAKLKRCESTRLYPTFNNQVVAKEFIRLMAERQNLMFKIDEMLETPGAYKVELSCGVYIIPSDLSEFYLYSSTWNNDRFQATYKEGLIIPECWITAQWLDNRKSILIRSVHPEMAFCLILDEKDGSTVLTMYPSTAHQRVHGASDDDQE